MATRLCHTRCTEDAHCTVGATCQNGVCISNAPGPRSPSRRFSDSQVAGITIGVTILVAMIAGSVVSFRLGWEIIRAVIAVVVLSAVTVLALGLGLGLPTQPEGESPPAPTSNGTSCGGFRTCAPYQCNLDVGRCFTGCDHANPCVDNYACDNGVCVRAPDPQAQPRQLMPSWAIAVTMFGAAIVLLLANVVVLKLCCGVYRARYRIAYNTALVSAVLLIVISAPTISSPILPKNDMPCADTEAVACEPYLCSLNSHLCFSACSSSRDCASSASCSNGVCVAPVVLPWLDGKDDPRGAGVAMYAIAGGIVAGAPFFIFMFRAFLRLRDSEDPQDSRRGRMCLGAGLIMCICVAPTVIAVVLSVVAVEHSPGGKGVKVKTWEPYMVAVLAFGWSTGFCFVMAIIARLGVIPNAFWFVSMESMMEDDNVGGRGLHARSNGLIVLVFMLSVSVVWVLILIGVGSYASVAQDPVIFSEAAGNGTACNGALAGICSPYYCDTTVEQCFDTCADDAHCTASGYRCRNGKCALTNMRGLLPPLIKPLVAVWVAVLGFTLCFALAAKQNGCTRCRPTVMNGLTFLRTPLVFTVAVCVGASISIVMLSMPLVKFELEYTPVVASLGAKCVQGTDIVCRPYMCDVVGGRCLSACAGWQDCSEGAFCKNGVCVPQPKALLYVTLAYWAVAVFFVALMCYPFLHRACLRANAARNAKKMHAVRQVAESFQEQQRLVVKAEIDVTPASPDTFDLTVPTPRGLNPAILADDGSGPNPDVLEPVGAGERTEPECCICLVNPPSVRLVGRSCKHGFCQECAQASLQAIMDSDQFPARCPGCAAEDEEADDTRSLIPSDVIERLIRRAVLTLAFGRRFIRLQLMKAFSPNDILSCPSCNLLSVRPDVSGKSAKEPRRFRVECDGCRTAYCSNCYAFWISHEKLTCEQAAESLQRGNDPRSVLLLLSTSKNCPNCGCPFTHYRDHGCHHIAPGTGCMRCGYHFCCVCLDGYPCSGMNHTSFCDAQCDCPPCPDCKPGLPCVHCGGSCVSCSTVNVAPRMVEAFPNPFVPLPLEDIPVRAAPSTTSAVASSSARLSTIAEAPLAADQLCAWTNCKSLAKPGCVRHTCARHCSKFDCTAHGGVDRPPGQAPPSVTSGRRISLTPLDYDTALPATQRANSLYTLPPIPQSSAGSSDEDVRVPPVLRASSLDDVAIMEQRRTGAGLMWLNPYTRAHEPRTAKDKEGERVALFCALANTTPSTAVQCLSLYNYNVGAAMLFYHEEFLPALAAARKAREGQSQNASSDGKSPDDAADLHDAHAASRNQIAPLVVTEGGRDDSDVSDLEEVIGNLSANRLPFGRNRRRVEPAPSGAKLSARGPRARRARAHTVNGAEMERQSGSGSASCSDSAGHSDESTSEGTGVRRSICSSGPRDVMTAMVRMRNPSDPYPATATPSAADSVIASGTSIASLSGVRVQAPRPAATALAGVSEHPAEDLSEHAGDESEHPAADVSHPEDGTGAAATQLAPDSGPPERPAARSAHASPRSSPRGDGERENKEKSSESVLSGDGVRQSSELRASDAPVAGHIPHPETAENDGKSRSPESTSVF